MSKTEASKVFVAARRRFPSSVVGRILTLTKVFASPLVGHHKMSRNVTHGHTPKFEVPLEVSHGLVLGLPIVTCWAIHTPLRHVSARPSQT